MQIEKHINGGKLSLALAGRLDTNTAPELESELKLDGVSELVFDFTDLEYISSAGLRVLMTAYKQMSSSGGKMAIAHPNDMVKGVFEMTGLGDIFTVEE